MPLHRGAAATPSTHFSDRSNSVQREPKVFPTFIRDEASQIRAGQKAAPGDVSDFNFVILMLHLICHLFSRFRVSGCLSSLVSLAHEVQSNFTGPLLLLKFFLDTSRENVHYSVS